MKCKKGAVVPGQRSLLTQGYAKRFYKGQMFSYEHCRKMTEAKAKNYEFESPDGVIYEGRNIGLFALEHGLNANMMRMIASGECYRYKGWTLPGRPVPPSFKSFELISPDGEIVKGHGVRRFAIAIGVAPGHLSNVVHGLRPQCKGWRLATEENIKAINSLISLETNGEPDPVYNPSFFKQINRIRLLRAQGYSYKEITIAAKVSHCSAVKYGKNVIKGQLSRCLSDSPGF